MAEFIGTLSLSPTTSIAKHKLGLTKELDSPKSRIQIWQECLTNRPHKKRNCPKGKWRNAISCSRGKIRAQVHRNHRLQPIHASMVSQGCRRILWHNKLLLYSPVSTIISHCNPNQLSIAIDLHLLRIIVTIPLWTRHHPAMLVMLQDLEGWVHLAIMISRKLSTRKCS